MPLEELQGHDRAWARFFALRGTILEESRTRSRDPYDLGGWGAFAAEARALAERPGLPEGAARAAERVLEYDRRWRTVEGFFESAREHGERWDALQEETKRRARRDPEFSIVDLPEYGPLSEFARGVRETGTAIRDDEETYRHRLDRALERLEGHVPLDRFAAVMDWLADTKRSARERGIPLVHDDAYNEAIEEAGSLAKESELEDAARRRLRAELDEHAFLAAQWRVIEQLLRDMGALEEQYRELQERAAREEIPRSLLPQWQDWREENRRFEEDARWTLYDDDLLEHWQSYPDILDSIEEGSQRARERIPERETGQIAEMVASELARLRGPDAEHAFSREWWGGEPLVAGDRLLLRQPPGGPKREAVVLGPGRSGGCASEDVLTLEWVTTAPGDAPEMPIQRIPVPTLADCGVRRADWTDERLREAELARQQPGPSAAFPLDCKRDVVVGDLLRWTSRAIAVPDDFLDPFSFVEGYRNLPGPGGGKERRRDRLGRVPANVSNILKRLIQGARLNTLAGVERFASPGEWLAELRRAAQAFYIAANIPVSELLFTDPGSWGAGEVGRKLGAAERNWPERRRPCGFLCWVAHDVSEYEINPADPSQGHIRVTSPVVFPSVYRRRVSGPYLFLGVVARSDDGGRWECRLAYAQPIVDPKCPIPVDSGYERSALDSLPRLVRDLRDDRGLLEALGGTVRVELQKPLFQFNGKRLNGHLLSFSRNEGPSALGHRRTDASSFVA